MGPYISDEISKYIVSLCFWNKVPQMPGSVYHGSTSVTPLCLAKPDFTWIQRKHLKLSNTSSQVKVSLFWLMHWWCFKHEHRGHNKTVHEYGTPAIITSAQYSRDVFVQWHFIFTVAWIPPLYSNWYVWKNTKKFRWPPREQGTWGQHGVHLGPVGPRWAPRWPHEPCYQGL